MRLSLIRNNFLILNANLNLKTDLKSALFIKYINVQLVNSQFCLNIKKIKQRGTLRIRAFFSLENNKKIYEFFFVKRSGFYKSNWYWYLLINISDHTEHLYIRNQHFISYKIVFILFLLKPCDQTTFIMLLTIILPHIKTFVKTGKPC